MKVIIRETLKEIDKLMMAEKGYADGDILDILVTLVEAYEAQNYSLELLIQLKLSRFENGATKFKC